MALTDLERKLAIATDDLDDALDRLGAGGGNYDEVQQLEKDVNRLYHELEQENNG